MSRFKELQHIEHIIARRIARNTLEYYRPNGNRVVRYHHTDIAEWSADGATVCLSTGGYFTLTTRSRLTAATGLCFFGPLNGPWEVGTQPLFTTPFYDGIVLPIKNRRPSLEGFPTPTLAKAFDNGLRRHIRIISNNDFTLSDAPYDIGHYSDVFLQPLAAEILYGGHSALNPSLELQSLILQQLAGSQELAEIRLGSRKPALRQRARKIIFDKLRQHFADIYTLAAGKSHINYLLKTWMRAWGG